MQHVSKPRPGYAPEGQRYQPGSDVRLHILHGGGGGGAIGAGFCCGCGFALIKPTTASTYFDGTRTAHYIGDLRIHALTHGDRSSLDGAKLARFSPPPTLIVPLP